MGGFKGVGFYATFGEEEEKEEGAAGADDEDFVEGVGYVYRYVVRIEAMVHISHQVFVHKCAHQLSPCLRSTYG